MRVLFVSSGRRGKPGPIIISQGESLKKSAIEVDYITAGPGLRGYLSAIPSIRRAWKKGRYDLVHAHYSLSAFAASFAGRFPMAVSLMGSDVFMSAPVRTLIRILSRYRWNATIVKSARMKEKLRLPRAEVIPNGVDTTMFSPEPQMKARERLGIDPSRRVVLFGSSADRREKNPDLAEKAFALLDYPGAEMMYLSDLSHDEVPGYLNSADVLLLTSDWEGSPNVIKEAMACNCPFVSTDVGDVRWLSMGVKGCFITSSDPVDIAAGIRNALDLRGRSEGRERIIRIGLDSGSVAMKIKSVYETVIA